MKITRRASRRATLATASIGALALLVGTAGTAQAATAPGLGRADSFAVLAGSGVTNTGPTTITGDLGTHPTPAVEGAADITISGEIYADNAPTPGAKEDLVTAYNNAASQGPTIPITTDLAGLRLVPGVYNSGSTIGLSGELILDALGDPNAVWVFQAGSGLTVGESASVTVVNGAQACNVFWQVGSTATLGTSARFVGTIMAMTSITLATGAEVQGRVLARAGSVTMDTNTITRPVCAAPSTPADTGGTDGSTTTGGTDGTTTTGVTSGTESQVTDVPSGSVATGDGSTSPRPFDALLAAGVVAIGAGAVIFVGRRRGLIA